MKAGSLKHRVTISAPTQVQSSADGSIGETWTTLDTVWASIEPISTREQANRQQAALPEATHSVRIRYLSGITSRCKVVYGSRTLDIVGPPMNVKEANAEMVLVCKEAE